MHTYRHAVSSRCTKNSFLRRFIAHDLRVVVMHTSGIKQRCTAEHSASIEQQGNETSLSNIYSIETIEYRLRSKY
jgi:hypothetical protein